MEPGVIPWDLVYHVTRLGTYLPENVTLEQFQTEYVEKVQPFSIPLMRTERATLMLESGQVGIVIGDAFMSANYRLGIGVNSIINGLRNLIVFISKLSASPRSEWKELAEEKNKIDDARLTRLTHYQAQVMFLEAYCGYQVFFLPPLPEDMEEDVLFYDDASEDYLEYPTKDSDPPPVLNVFRHVNRVYEHVPTEEAWSTCVPSAEVCNPFAGVCKENLVILNRHRNQ